MSIDRFAPVDEQIEALLGSEARRWTKTLPAERQAWLERCGPRNALPEWLIDAERDLTARGVEIIDFAECGLAAGIRERTMGAVGDSIYVMAAARLIPDASTYRDQVLPLLDDLWGALNENDHLGALLTLPLISGLAGQARQMLDSLPRPAPAGRKPGPSEVGAAYDQAVADIIRRVDGGTDKQADVINEWATHLDRPELELESIKTQLRDRVRGERRRRSNGEQLICADSGGAYRFRWAPRPRWPLKTETKHDPRTSDFAV